MSNCADFRSQVGAKLYEGHAAGGGHPRPMRPGAGRPYPRVGIAREC